MRIPDNTFCATGREAGHNNGNIDMEFIHFLQDTPAAVICLAIIAWWSFALAWLVFDQPVLGPAAKLARMARTPAYQEGFLRGYRAARNEVAS